MKKKTAIIVITTLAVLLAVATGFTLCLALNDYPLKAKPIPNYYANKLTSP